MLEKIPSIVGKALAGLRPGIEATLAHAEFGAAPETLAVESPAFGHEAPLPQALTQDGVGQSPPLTWRNAPAGTAEIVIVIEDADSPTPAPLVHAIVYGLPREGELAAGALDESGTAGVGNPSLGKAAYLPPDPPAGHGAHRYVVQAFALGKPSGLTGEPGRSAVVAALKGKVSAKGVLIGTYERP